APRRHPPRTAAPVPDLADGQSLQAELAGSRSARAFRRDIAWCWDLEPRLPVTGEVHEVILVDGIWIETWCLLIALTTTNTVVGW
ncbi:hypothetical protein ACO1LK_13805, partial [Staphylococcus aureus]